MVDNKGNRVFMSRNYRSDIYSYPWKFDVLKIGISALEASLLGQIFVLRTSNFRGQLSADSFSTEALYCLISVQWLEVVDERATFFSFFQRFRGKF